MTQINKKLEGEGTVVGKLAPYFALPDHLGGIVNLAKVLDDGPVLLVFYPKDFTSVCTKQLCNYTDNIDAFKNFGLQIIGVSMNSATTHKEFASRFNFPFRLVTDAQHKVAKQFGCASIFMFGRLSRACFIINKNRVILYRYVEPTVLTHRSAAELLLIIQDLRANKLL